jgi:hypothetical protein
LPAEAPGGPPASAGDDASNATTTTPSETVPTDSAPSSVQSEAAVAPLAHEAAAANGPASEPALEPDAAANDNEPVVELPATGTE